MPAGLTCIGSLTTSSRPHRRCICERLRNHSSTLVVMVRLVMVVAASYAYAVDYVPKRRSGATMQSSGSESDVYAISAGCDFDDGPAKLKLR